MNEAFRPRRWSSRSQTVAASVIGVLLAAALFQLLAIRPPSTQADEGSERPPTAAQVAPSVAEARSRARLLHETIHGALLIMHRDFFDEERSRAIPSKSLEDMFGELERNHRVAVGWLAVNANAMSIDNKPRSPFEEAAVEALATGQQEYEAVEDGTYRFAGRIRLASQCLKCHLPLRSGNKERSAGLVISMSLNDR